MRVEHLALGRDAKQAVGRGHRVALAPPPVEEVGVWVPDGLQHDCVERQHLHRGAVESESGVGPALAEEDIDAEFLGRRWE